MLSHLILPLFIIGLAGTGVTIRVMRNNLLDELQKQYVITARAKGVSETKLLFKYPVRMAMNPVMSTIGWLLPAIFAGEVLVSLILGLDSWTTAPAGRAGPGHVSGRQHHSDPECADRHRHVDLRHRLGVDGPMYPLRRGWQMSVTDPVKDPQPRVLEEVDIISEDGVADHDSAVLAGNEKEVDEKFKLCDTVATDSSTLSASSPGLHLAHIALTALFCDHLCQLFYALCQECAL